MGCSGRASEFFSDGRGCCGGGYNVFIRGFDVGCLCMVSFISFICGVGINSRAESRGPSCCLAYKLIRKVAKQRVRKNKDRYVLINPC